MTELITDASHDNPNSSGTTSTNFQLGIDGFAYADLYLPERLRELAEVFYAEVERAEPEVHRSLMDYLSKRGAGYESKVESELLIAAAPHLSRFVARLFHIELEQERQIESVLDQEPVWIFKTFIARRALKKFPPEAAAKLDAEVLNVALQALRHEAFAETLVDDDELGIARMTSRLLECEKQLDKYLEQVSDSYASSIASLRGALAKIQTSHDGELFSEITIEFDNTANDDLSNVRAALRLIEAWAAAHSTQPVARERFRGWVSFHSPHQLDYQNLVQIERPRADLPELMQGLAQNLRWRDGFGLTDPRASKREVLAEVDYCLYCHERDKDSCSKGLFERDQSVKRNPLGIKLEGCPLKEKISEMHVLKKRGDSIAALAMVMIDNPMCPGTGHRICNDCMKSCIFQKQEPVNIPQAETGVLTDVLEMPYGFEIFSLLTRWNPINAKRPFALPYNGKNILVVGLGPAGYTLAHFLLNEGFGVVGIDGLKIEPLTHALSGGEGDAPKPVRDVADIETRLDQRVLAGFGGVSEYGITVRWDKNFLTLIHLALARRDHFRFYGGVRFGGTLTIDDAWSMGFDHIAIATGAGKPTIVSMKNNLIRGIRKASDFLMALQLTGAFKRDALANLQVRLPAIVIGGGLTAIDTATELFAYYPVQVEKMLARHEELVAQFGEEEVRRRLDPEELNTYDEFLAHGKAIRAERERALGAGEAPDFISLVRNWGGVSIVYRKRLQDSPAYRLNHEEVVKSLEEGITYIEKMSPYEAVPDEHGAVKEIVFERWLHDEETHKWECAGEFVNLPARTVCVAAGTSPNIIYEKEKPGTFALDEWNEFFAPHTIERGGDGLPQLAPAGKDSPGFFTSYQNDGRFISYYGDNHPIYAGNVVKAMASAKDGYEHVTALFADELARLDPADQPKRERAFSRLTDYLDEQLSVRVVRVDRLTETIVDVIVHAPMQARKFHPGQFYRLQNYETDSRLVHDTKLMMEGIALTGAWVDVERGLLSLIVLEMGVSSRLCATLKPGQRVVVMGPTGTPTEIPENETVLLAGGGLGNAVLFSIARALREKGNRVVYFAGYKRGEDLFKREEIEAATDQVVWATDTGVEIEPYRPQDSHFRGNIVQAMLAYAKGELGDVLVRLLDVDRVIAIGSDRMMSAVKDARHAVLAPYLKPHHVGIGSINSPMQCMMKEVCAQCLQRHVDPITGKESFVFSCFNQDQPLDEVDFKNLNARLRANTVQEKQANLWLDKLLRDAEIERV
jgi:NADPH-dependent glutamate synthase beta subunit-like oxidoreductase/NAD(P)H-flavin reductase